MKQFLTLKASQIFGIGIACFVLFFLEIIFINAPFLNFVLELTMLFVFSSFFFGWYYAVGTETFKLIPNSDKAALKKFKISLSILATITLLLIIYYATSYFDDSSSVLSSDDSFLIFALFYLTYFICIVYWTSFIAESLKSAELQRPAIFSEYRMDILLIWFFIIGVWYIQPRVNKLFNK
ncbi:MAG: hypothetical protein K0S53_1569 [Bacteroidetes bacterium]|jgi:hypothetical protein|nr:hypothetical protein [Bacteroidota bacterium]